MKNIITVAEKADIHDFVLNLWKTDIFRDSHANNGFIHDIVDQFAWLPRLFYEMSNEHLERSHFSTWWNAMTLRSDYTNPVIHDLYWLHEFYHAGHMPYIPGIGKEAFDEKMQRNELEASTLSEIQIYFEMPELRAMSFDHEIYADRYLDDDIMKTLWKNNKAVAIETFRTIRRDVMVSKPEHLMDRTETWIRKFNEQNAVHSIVWSDSYNDIEVHMHDFQFNASYQCDYYDRKAAILGHKDWLERKAALDTVDNIPFRQEAELFAPFYWANKEKHAKAMLAKTS